MPADVLCPLFASYAGAQPESLTELPVSGSHRRYFRIAGGGRSVIGVIGTDNQENNAFVQLARHFRSQGINVPQVLAVAPDGLSYLQQDLGSTSLFDSVADGRKKGVYSPEEVALLSRSIAALPRLQFLGAQGLDWSVCYPQPSFDERSVDFDLNYFKYCFLKATGLEFNEVLLQEDFDRLKADLLRTGGDTFLHRDFQARNVMLVDGEPYFIDFQGGRRGPIYYDVASFISQARSRFPQSVRDTLTDAYLDSLSEFTHVDRDEFRANLRLFVLFRTLQVLGAYGFRGYFEKKPHFLASVPYAIESLRGMLREPFGAYPYLNSVLEQLTLMPQYATTADDTRLLVHICSFAYKKGIPEDASGNGGGYVFDCRSINNPGKYEHYRHFNGTDREVIDFLEEDGGVTVFLDSVYKLVDAHVQRFMERGFTNLQVCFGCTGGQHRSVYCAENMARHLLGKYDVKVLLTHRELGIEKRM